MEDYLLFIIISTIAIASPGQGIIYTISNTSKYGYKKSINGILGIIVGSIFLATISISSIGALLMINKNLLFIIQIIGAFYLIFIAISQLFFINKKNNKNKNNNNNNNRSLFLTAFFLTLLNPKSIIFFSSFFPQFTSINSNYLSDMIILMFIFSTLVFIIHSIYSSFIIYLGTKIDNIKKLHIDKISSYVFLIAGIFILVNSLFF